MKEVQIVTVNPMEPRPGLLIPFLTQRMLAFARDFASERDPETLVRGWMTRLYSGDPTIGLIAFVADGMKVVGHALVTLESDGRDKWFFVSQLRIDGDVGDALDVAFDRLRAEGRRIGVTRVLMATGRNEGAFARRFGFKTVQRVLARPVEDEESEERELTASGV